MVKKREQTIDTPGVDEAAVSGALQIAPTPEAPDSAAGGVADVTGPRGVGDSIQSVHIALPRSVLFALIDPAHPDANVPGAEYYGLLQQGELTPIGALVLGGTDQTALRHKLVAAWRAATNAALKWR
jgi:hypothetical protein